MAGADNLIQERLEANACSALLIGRCFPLSW